MNRADDALGHIRSVPEARKVIWPCMLQAEELQGREAAGSRSTDTQAIPGELRGKYSLRCGIDPEWSES